jgi:hypothetical protein
VSSLDAPLPDAWFTRDLPVLRAIARLVDGPRARRAPYLGQVVPASGLPKPDVSRRRGRWCRPATSRR